jgi:hypothetical protein
MMMIIHVWYGVILGWARRGMADMILVIIPTWDTWISFLGMKIPEHLLCGAIIEHMQSCTVEMCIILLGGSASMLCSSYGDKRAFGCVAQYRFSANVRLLVPGFVCLLYAGVIIHGIMCQ